jgi:hypothetical protein
MNDAPGVASDYKLKPFALIPLVPNPTFLNVNPCEI